MSRIEKMRPPRRAALFSVKNAREAAERHRKRFGNRCSCGKIIHRSLAAARDHIDNLLAIGEPGEHVTLDVYACDRCHYYHVGHSSYRPIPPVEAPPCTRSSAR